MNFEKPVFDKAVSAIFIKLFLGHTLYISGKPATYILMVNPNED